MLVCCLCIRQSVVTQTEYGTFPSKLQIQRVRPTTTTNVIMLVHGQRLLTRACLGEVVCGTQRRVRAQRCPRVPRPALYRSCESLVSRWQRVNHFGRARLAVRGQYLVSNAVENDAPSCLAVDVSEIILVIYIYFLYFFFSLFCLLLLKANKYIASV